MQSAVETLSPTRVRLTVEVPFVELQGELTKAYKTIGAQVKVQGFRPGKVPPRILDQRVGRDVVLQEAVQEALPRLYGEAVEETGVFPVNRPEVAVTELADNDKLTFTAEVDVRPDFELPSYDALSITVDDVLITDEELTEQVDGVRERFGRLVDVERPAGQDDYVALDLVATVDGQELPGGNATGLSYQVGAGNLLEGLDEALVGASAGDVRAFQTSLVAGEQAGAMADVAITVRGVQERELPEATDDWAAEATGFASMEELTADMRSRLDRVKRLEQGMQARDKALDALLSAVELPLPESIVTGEKEWRRRTAEEQLQRGGLDLDAWLSDEGKTAEQ